MKLNVAAEMKLPGKTGSVHEAIKQDDMEYNQRVVRFAAPLTLDAVYVFDGAGFNVRGTLSTVLKSECALCMKEFEEPMQFDFEERFEKNSGSDDETFAFIGEELDLSQMVRDNIFLHLPINSVCSEDCKGLCPRCGCNLNTAQCSCKQNTEEQSNPFSVLGKLLKDKEV